MKITIKGDPIAKMRARHSTRHGYVRTYDPQEKEKEFCKMQVIAEIKKNGLKFDQDALFELDMTFYLPCLKTWTESKRNANLWGLCYESHKPDLDNLEKHVNDVLNGIIYKDDSQVIKLSSKKIYSINPRTEIKIMEVKERNLPNHIKKVFEAIDPEECNKMFSDVNNLDFIDHNNLEDAWFRIVGKKLIEFSQKYAKTLLKISKISQDDKHET